LNAIQKSIATRPKSACKAQQNQAPGAAVVGGTWGLLLLFHGQKADKRLAEIKLWVKSIQSWHRRFVFSDHLTTLTARAKVSPICFATFKVITSSNFVGRFTGSSAGLAT
jgi:hypothetical protein